MAKSRSNPSATDWREARNFTAAVMEKRSGTPFGAAAYTLFSNPYADWQDRSTVVTKGHYADFSLALQGCWLKDLVALDVRYRGDSAAFAASFLCPQSLQQLPAGADVVHRYARRAYPGVFLSRPAATDICALLTRARIDRHRRPDSGRNFNMVHRRDGRLPPPHCRAFGNPCCVAGLQARHDPVRAMPIAHRPKC